MKLDGIEARLTFTEPLLGSLPNNPELLEEFVAAKAPTGEAMREEIAALPVEEQIERKKTVFARTTDGHPCLWDYHMRGYLKSALATLIELGDCAASKWQIKGIVDSFVFVSPRRIPILGADGAPAKVSDQLNQRSLRAETLRGDRVALAASEEIPAGARLEVRLELLTGSNAKSKKAVLTLADLRAALDYGKFKGLGQWRSGGWGRFVWEEINGA